LSDPLKIWTCHFTRSEYGPLNPFLEVCEKEGVQCKALDLSGVKETRAATLARKSLRSFQPDVVLCPFDRPEMAKIASLVYHMGYPIAQTYAGDIAGGAWDDSDRFVISNYATYLFTADLRQHIRMTKAMAWRQEVEWRTVIECVGPTAFDDMRYQPVEESGYALVLYNPPSLASDRQLEIELFELSEILNDEPEVYWVEPNGDPRSDRVIEYAQTFNYLENMDRPEFLGWLRNAATFYGNSSAGAYEAPYFGVPWHPIGMRNQFREKVSLNMRRGGASKRIIEVLKRELKYVEKNVSPILEKGLS